MILSATCSIRDDQNRVIRRKLLSTYQRW